MDLLALTGFLGSGKTTLLLALASRFTADGKKIAIIENEVGKVGIDDQLVRDRGYTVSEIYSGCVCCTLRGNLLNALYEIERDLEPDLVILETSGAAAPGPVRDSLAGYGGEIGHLIFIFLLDGHRFEAVYERSQYYVEQGMKDCDLVVLNKADLLTERAAEKIKKKMSSFTADGTIHVVSGEKDNGIDGLYGYIGSIVAVNDKKIVEINKQTAPSDEKVLHQIIPGGKVCARDIQLSFNKPVSAAMLEDDVRKVLKSMIDGLVKRGMRLIGHVKCIVKGRENGYMLFSQTAVDDEMKVKGRLKTMVDSVNLTVNAIVYDVDKDVLEDEMDKMIAAIESWHN